MNKMKILVTYAGIWKSDTGSTGLTLNYFMYGDNDLPSGCNWRTGWTTEGKSQS